MWQNQLRLFSFQFLIMVSMSQVISTVLSRQPLLEYMWKLLKLPYALYDVSYRWWAVYGCELRMQSLLHADPVWRRLLLSSRHGTEWHQDMCWSAVNLFIYCCYVRHWELRTAVVVHEARLRSSSLCRIERLLHHITLVKALNHSIVYM